MLLHADVVAFAQGDDRFGNGGGPVVSVGLLLAGLVTALAGHRRYVRNERAIAADQPLPVSRVSAWVTGLVALLVTVLLVLVVLEAVRG